MYPEAFGTAIQKRSGALGQECAQIVKDLFLREIFSDIQSQAAMAIAHKHTPAMLDARIRPGALRDRDLVVLDNTIDVGTAAGQTNEVRIKSLEKTCQLSGCVVFRVDGNEQYLHVRGILAERPLDCGEAHQRRCADVRAMRKAEEQDAQSAVVVGQSDRPSLMIKQRVVAAPGHATQIDRIEVNRALAARKNQRAHDAQCDDPYEVLDPQQVHPQQHNG